MSAVPQPVPDQHQPPNKTVSATHATFLNYLPAVQTHAAIKFRHLSAIDREEAVAEATAAAFVNVRHALRNGNGHRLRPTMVAHYAVLHVKDGRHVGGTADSTSDVLSRRAQRRGGFKVVGLRRRSQVGQRLGVSLSARWREAQVVRTSRRLRPM